MDGENEAVHVVPMGWQLQATWLPHITRITAYFHYTSPFLGDHIYTSLNMNVMYECLAVEV